MADARFPLGLLCIALFCTPGVVGGVVLLPSIRRWHLSAAICQPGSVQVALKKPLTTSHVSGGFGPTTGLQPPCDHSHVTSSRCLLTCPFIAGLLH
jgi:hypothetical protein